MKQQKKPNASAFSDNMKTDIVIHGLEKFFKKLEKDFFAEVSIQGFHYSDTRKTDLIVDFYCNFSIIEGFRYYSDEDWDGPATYRENGKQGYPFHELFQNMKKQNSDPVDIREISFYFEDTSIIISRIHDYSIPEQISTILLEINNHLLYLTKGETQIPYEIFIPVFEDKRQKTPELKEKQTTSYFEYWGIYLENNEEQHDPMIYDLKTKELRHEDFFLL